MDAVQPDAVAPVPDAAGPDALDASEPDLGGPDAVVDGGASTRIDGDPANPMSCDAVCAAAGGTCDENHVWLANFLVAGCYAEYTGGCSSTYTCADAPPRMLECFGTMRALVIYRCGCF
jgi:hypothetical protein